MSSSTTSTSTSSKFYDFSPLDKKGQPYPFKELKGKVVLIVNVASKCGFTPQYQELQELYTRYHDKGLEIIGFPCNQFGKQEPGSDEEIGQFCQLNYGVTFPIMKKINVNGSDADPLWEYLKQEKPGLLGFKGIKWNFEKFLIEKDGKIHDRYSSLTKPANLDHTIGKLLNK
ncbi:LAME_0C08152g1_1 [Lachancea meyersii CBS 8951]|uniref:Glutathione peroxidase n=1 Tax=Lachancea meyersii CBS 8951 TaxID=1266667 RepID=A0A1G4J2Z2_9SACH|nr:LAME_0C08152g1_1 [Lachancea meyersii CBS 8951]